MEVVELVKAIAVWVTNNSYRESIFLNANPGWLLDPHELMDHISSITGVSEDQIGKWCEEEQKKIDQRKAEKGD